METKHPKVPMGAVVQALLFVIVVPFLPLLISQRWSWWAAWAFAVISVLGFAISRRLAAKRNPGLIEERAHFMQHEDTKSWDKVLARLVGLGGAAIPLVAGLDARFGWSPPFGTWTNVIALVVLLVGYVGSSYALIENRFFSGEVRIQKEREHEVISTGPYGLVRHPGYAGALLVYLAVPFLLDSWWSLIPAGVLAAVLVVRTALEDAMLREELAGYRAYADRVRYRLLPGVW